MWNLADPQKKGKKRIPRKVKLTLTRKNILSGEWDIRLLFGRFRKERRTYPTSFPR